MELPVRGEARRKLLRKLYRSKVGFPHELNIRTENCSSDALFVEGGAFDGFQSRAIIHTYSMVLSAQLVEDENAESNQILSRWWHPNK